MKRTLAASILCLLHLAFIIVPEVQIWPHLNKIVSHNKVNEVSVSKSKKSPMVGDIMYLTALIERAKNTDDSKEKNTIPEITISHTGLIYLHTRDTDINLLFCEKVNHFIDFQQHTICGIRENTSPPPKFIFC